MPGRTISENDLFIQHHTGIANTVGHGFIGDIADIGAGIHL